MPTGYPKLRWTSDEDAVLVAEYPEGGAAAVGDRIDRSPWSIRRRAILLGVKTTINSRPSECDEAAGIILRDRILALGGEPQLPQRMPLTFEEELAAVSRGARLVAAFIPSRPDYEFTLGGVSSI